MMRSAPRSLRFLLSCAALALAASHAQAQVCEGNIFLTTQAQVDAFDCTEVTGDLSIGLPTAPTTISDLSGLSELISVGGHLTLANIGTLTSLVGIENLTSVGGSLVFYSMGALASLDALGGLTSVGNGLQIDNNDALTSLNGLGGLTSVGGNLKISRNHSLTDVDGLGGLTSVGGNLSISNNGALTSLDGLGGITSVGGLVVANNNALTSLDGLEGLTSVYYLQIDNNDALTSLDGLEGLTAVDFHLQIYMNGTLENVDGLASLTSVGSWLIISDNPSLSECTVGLAPLLLEGEIGESVSIRSNAPGCNSVEEILAGVDAEDGATPLVTGLAAPYPNPTAGAATVTFTLAEPGDVRLAVYDALGRRVRTLAEGPRAAGVYEASLGAGLPSGAYVVRFEAGGQAFTERVTVVR